MKLFLKALELLGTGVLYVVSPSSLKTVPLPDADLKASEGRSFINFDGFNPDQFLDRREQMGEE